MQHDLSGFSKRLEDLLARFDAKIKSHLGGEGPRDSRPRRQAYWTLRDLFTKDVTGKDLQNFVQRDTWETFEYFTKEIDFDSLRPLPFYKRYPIAAWRIFLALAYRLSPPRRIAFAIAIFAFLVGSFQFLQFSGEVPQGTVRGYGSGVGWWFISIAILLLLLVMELRDKLSLKGDLEIAREIQMGLVPSKPHEQEGFSIHCRMRPANTVGGDYYDILNLGDHRLGVVIGDVSGKGMPAALLMALLQGSLRTLVTAGHRGIELVTKLNEYLCTNIPAHSLITLFYGELDTSSGNLNYINCGHNAPMLLRADQSLLRLPSTSIVLGIQREPDFHTGDISLAPGEVLLLFTDGITEAFNVSEEEYGEPRLATDLQNLRTQPPEQILQRLVDDVLSFCGNVRPVDDMTLMLITRKEPQ